MYVQGCKEKIIIGGNMYMYAHRNGAGGAEGKGGCDCIWKYNYS